MLGDLLAERAVLLPFALDAARALRAERQRRVARRALSEVECLVRARVDAERAAALAVDLAAAGAASQRRRRAPSAAAAVPAVLGARQAAAAREAVARDVKGRGGPVGASARDGVVSGEGAPAVSPPAT